LVALLAVTPLAGAKSGKGQAPDLVVTKVSKPPASELAGSKLTVVVQLSNKGTAKAGKSRLGLYLAKGKKHTKKDRRLKQAKLKPLKSGKKAKAKLKIVLPANTKAGTYRLIACADDGKKVRESKESDNCRATKKFAVKTAVPPPAAPGAAAFSMTDGLDWGFVEDAAGQGPGAGKPVTVSLRAANGLAGQAGYTRSAVASGALMSGTTVPLSFGTRKDDGQVTLQLPFAFPFGGVSEQSVSVSTNGWVSFGGSPAWDYWDDSVPNDYRGVAFVVGELERGIMPYWGDLDVGEQGTGTGTVNEVIAADGSAVAFEWDLGQHGSAGAPRRVFQLVLYPDGRFRFDYPGTNAAGGGESFVGYSLGNGNVDVVANGVKSVPATSLLFTPNPVSAGSALAAGQMTMTMPAGSALVSGPGCSVAKSPTKFTAGLLSCATPALGIGQQLTQSVVFSMPPNAPGESLPANFKYTGTYLSGGSSLLDRDEIDRLNTSLEATTITPLVNYVGAAPKVGVESKFVVPFSAALGGLDEPSATVALPPNATLKEVRVNGENLECGVPSPGTISCPLPSGISSAELEIFVTPTAAGSPLKLAVTVQALNAPSATANGESPNVEP
jgi:hypothetical protein